MRYLSVSLPLLLPLLAVPLQAKTIYVDADRSGQGSQTGTGWGTAYADLQDALADASANDQIFIAEGLYYPDEAEAGVASGIGNNDRYEEFNLPSGVQIYGGFNGTGNTAGDADPAQYLTILSGDLQQDDTTVNGVVVTSPETNISGNNAYTVVSGAGVAAGTLLSGVTITGGSAGDGTFGYTLTESGGGLHVNSGDLTVEDCVIQGNLSTMLAGGVLVDGDSNVSFLRCEIKNNTASETADITSGLGGGFYMNDTASVSLTDCAIDSNVAAISAGGFRVSVGTTLELQRCMVRGNQAQAEDGGGLYAATAAALTVNNTLISGNWTHDDGGGVYLSGSGSGELLFTNTTLSGNSTSALGSGNVGGGLYVYNATTAVLTNCIVWNNRAGGFGENDSIAFQGGALTANYSIVEGKTTSELTGSNNFDGTDAANDPLFTAELNPESAPSTGGDFSLQFASLLTNVGDSAAVSGATDLAGETREILTVDLGAYELQNLKRIYVDASRSSEAVQDGVSWATAYADLQDALASATSSVDIWVADGTYYPDEAEAGVATVVADSREVSFQLVEGVGIYGGFSGGETSLDERDPSAHVTILSGDVGIQGVDTDNVYHVVVGSGVDSSAILDGFTIEGGYANGPNSDLSQGGGLYFFDGSPRIKSCIIQDHYGFLVGAVSGYNPAVTEVVELVDCQLISNKSAAFGSAIYTSQVDLRLTSCVIRGNDFVASIDDFDGTVVILDGSLDVVNCLITGNRAPGAGGIELSPEGGSGHTLNIYNSTITGNYASDDRTDAVGGIKAISATCNVYNSIIWNNRSAGSDHNIIGLDTQSDSLIEGEAPGFGNVDGTDANNAPQFAVTIDAALDTPTTSGDFRLMGNSPLLSLGDDSLLPVDSADLDGDEDIAEDLPLDLDGRARVISALDLGAYEYDGPIVAAEPEANYILEVSDSGSTLLDFGSIFSESGLTYTTSVDPEGVLTLSTSGDTLNAVSVGSSGESASVTVTAVDADGFQVTITFDVLLLETVLTGDANLSSWMVENAGQYARLFKRSGNFTADLTTTYTTWDDQDLPVYADVQKIDYSNDYVYVHASGLASYVMGPWYSSTGGEYRSWPTNQQVIFKMPRTPSEETGTKPNTGAATSGLLVNGTAIYGALDGFAYAGDGLGDSTLNGNEDYDGQVVVFANANSDHYWHRTAPYAEGYNFDAGNAHQPGNGTYHTHTNPIALRYQLGDHVDYDVATNVYSESAGMPGEHSPIIGWAEDGFPIYGPYGYDDPGTLGGSIRRMVPGFVLRDGTTAGVDDVDSNRTTIPSWYARYRQDVFGGGVATSTGAVADGPGMRPVISDDAPYGWFAQDWEYLGDATVSYVEGTDFDLDVYSGRICKTPEYPDGTYAYFLPIDSAGDAVYPFSLGFQFYGETDNTTGVVDTISESVTTHYIGGPNADLDLKTPIVDSDTGEISLVWNGLEGGTYEVSSSDTENGSYYTEIASVVGSGGYELQSFIDADGEGYARVRRAILASYDEALTAAEVPSSALIDTEAYAESFIVWYVDADRSGQGSQDGTSWATAFADLQDALASAVDGDEIWIAEGVYYPDEAEAGIASATDGSSSERFALISGVGIYGGFDGSETTRDERDWSAHRAVLSGDIGQDDSNTDAHGVLLSDAMANVNGTNSNVVVIGTSDTSGMLDGVTITATNGFSAVSGGGTYRRCTIQGNYGSDAGAVYQEGEVFSLIESDILNNQGGVVGAISAFGNDALIIASCRIQGNEAFNDNSSSCGAIRFGNGNGELTNCLISGNRGYTTGGLLIRIHGELTVNNSTIAGNYSRSNSADIGVAGGLGAADASTIKLNNTLVWGNEAAGGADNISGIYTADLSLIEGKTIVAGDSNLDGNSASNDPLFYSLVSAASGVSASGDYRVPGHSPVVDAGDAIENPGDPGDLDEDGNTSEILPEDLVGTHREINETDIGAYEYDGPTVANAITANVEVEMTPDSQDLVNLDSVFGSNSLTYALVSISPATGVIETTYTSGSQFTASVPEDGEDGDTAVVTISATDADGDRIELSFTVEVVELFVANDPSDVKSVSLSSWMTERSSRYARIYEEYADEGGEGVATWDVVPEPVYAGPQEISYTDSAIYVKTSTLSTHIMGPWYLPNGELFQNLPGNQDGIYEFPRVAEIPVAKTDFTGGMIGLMVDGAMFFSSSDTYSWDNDEDGTGNGTATGPTENNGQGDGVWNHDAKVTESATFDPSNAHSAGDQFHYHASPSGIRYLLGDNMDYDSATNEYEEITSSHPDFDGSATHSPIIGWLRDGLPLYGPYGYTDPLDADSYPRRMRSGFVLRDGANGTYDVAANGRDRLPDWSVAVQGIGPVLTVNQYGPDVDATYFVGYFMEDYAFKGDVGYNLYDGVGEFDEDAHYDLNEYNVRYCVTPEFPEGTWAYFTNIDENADLAFPYNVAQQYFGNPDNGGAVNAVPTNDGDEVITFQGGASKVESATSIAPEGNDIVLVWDAVEGGHYEIETTTSLSESWVTSPQTVVAGSDALEVADEDALIDEEQKFYRITRIDIEPYSGDDDDGTGGDSFTLDNLTPNNGNGGPPQSAGSVTVSFTISGGLYPDGTLTAVALTGTNITGTALTTGMNGYGATLTLAGPPGTYDFVATFSDGTSVTGAGAFTINGGAM